MPTFGLQALIATQSLAPAMAAQGTHNRQLTLSLWWACSALKLERDRANGGVEDDDYGNYRASALNLHRRVAKHQQAPQVHV